MLLLFDECLLIQPAVLFCSLLGITVSYIVFLMILLLYVYI